MMLYIFINDVSLIEMIRIHDFKHYPDKPSSISELNSQSLFNNVKYNRIDDWYEDDMKIVLACSCGDDCCGSVRIRAEEKGNTVIWKDMLYGHGLRKYKFDKFVFDKKKYEKQLAILKALSY